MLLPRQSLQEKKAFVFLRPVPIPPIRAYCVGECSEEEYISRIHEYADQRSHARDQAAKSAFQEQMIAYMRSEEHRALGEMAWKFQAFHLGRISPTRQASMVWVDQQSYPTPPTPAFFSELWEVHDQMMYDFLEEYFLSFEFIATKVFKEMRLSAPDSLDFESSFVQIVPDPRFPSDSKARFSPEFHPPCRARHVLVDPYQGSRIIYRDGIRWPCPNERPTAIMPFFMTTADNVTAPVVKLLIHAGEFSLVRLLDPAQGVPQVPAGLRRVLPDALRKPIISYMRQIWEAFNWQVVHDTMQLANKLQTKDFLYQVFSGDLEGKFFFSPSVRLHLLFELLSYRVAHEQMSIALEDLVQRRQHQLVLVRGLYDKYIEACEAYKAFKENCIPLSSLSWMSKYDKFKSAPGQQVLKKMLEEQLEAFIAYQHNCNQQVDTDDEDCDPIDHYVRDNRTRAKSTWIDRRYRSAEVLIKEHNPATDRRSHRQRVSRYSERLCTRERPLRGLYVNHEVWLYTDFVNDVAKTRMEALEIYPRLFPEVCTGVRYMLPEDQRTRMPFKQRLKIQEDEQLRRLQSQQRPQQEAHSSTDTTTLLSVAAGPLPSVSPQSEQTSGQSGTAQTVTETGTDPAPQGALT